MRKTAENRRKQRVQRILCQFSSTFIALTWFLFDFYLVFTLIFISKNKTKQTDRRTTNPVQKRIFPKFNALKIWIISNFMFLWEIASITVQVLHDNNGYNWPTQNMAYIFLELCTNLNTSTFLEILEIVLFRCNLNHEKLSK